MDCVVEQQPEYESGTCIRFLQDCFLAFHLSSELDMIVGDEIKAQLTLTMKLFVVSNESEELMSGRLTHVTHIKAKQSEGMLSSRDGTEK